MPPDSPEVGTPVDWLRHARSDLALARVERPTAVLLDTLCFHAQQAVEKSLKAVLLWKGVQFPYTHDIARLITLIQGVGIAWPEEFDQAADLTEYAVEARYPGSVEDITEEEYQRAISLAEHVLTWAAKLIPSTTEPHRPDDD